MPEKPFPAKDAEFNDYLGIAIPHLEANAKRLGVSESNLTALLAHWGKPLEPGAPSPSAANTFPAGSWNDLYPKSQDPSVRTRTITRDKNKKRKDIEALMRKIFRDIPNSAYTTEDRDVLNKPERDVEPTPAPLPNRAPTINIDKQRHLSITLRFQDPDNPHTSAKPPGVDEIEIEYTLAVTDPGVHPDKRTANTGRFLHTLLFDEKDAGKKVNIRARYINSSKQTGPWSTEISTSVT